LHSPFPHRLTGLRRLDAMLKKWKFYFYYKCRRIQHCG
jgi:hypothetical protein